MFDAEQYFTKASQALATCEAYAESEGPGISLSGGWDDWQLIDWRLHVVFSSGETLELLEIHSKLNNIHHRKIKYHFMDAEKVCIFRVDNHGKNLPFDDPCHVEIGPNEEKLEDGDPRLGGQSMKGIGFWEIFHWIHQHLDGGRLPWQQQ